MLYRDFDLLKLYKPQAADKPEVSPSTSRTRKVTFTTIFSVFLAFLIFQPTVVQAENRVEQLTLASGIYFENLGNVKITNNMYNLITFRDLKLYKAKHFYINPKFPK